MEMVLLVSLCAAAIAFIERQHVSMQRRVKVRIDDDGPRDR